MKKILLFIGLLVSFFAGAQMPTIPGVTNINQRYQWIDGYFNHKFRVPKDTTAGADSGTIKWYLDNFYFGYGDYNHPMIKYFATDPLPGDHLVLGSDGVTVVNQAATTQACNNVANIQLSYVSGLTYAYPSVLYNLNCIQYPLTGGTLTLAAGTASAGEFRQDLVYVDATGIHVRQGDNSVAGVASFPEVDEATEILVTYIRIDETNTTPTGPTATNIYQENAGGEFSHTTANLTAVFNYGTNPQTGDSSIRITAASNGGYIRFLSPSSPLSSNNYSNLTLWIRNNAIFSNNRRFVLRKTIAGVQVAGSSSITLTAARGYIQTSLNLYMLISIPMSAFGGSDSFDGIEIRNTGTGGTVNVQMDNIRLEQGVGTGSDKPDSPDRINGPATIDVISNMNGHKLTVQGGTISLGHIDSVGAVIDYRLPTNPIDGTLSVAGTTPTVNGTKMSINGTTTITFPYYTGSENWSFVLDSVVTKTNSSAVQNLTVQIIPVSGSSLFTRKITYVGADTARYLNYFKNDGSSTPDYTTRNVNRMVSVANDTLRITGRFRRGKIRFSVYNYTTGQTIELRREEIGATAGYYNIGNVGQVAISQIGNFEYFGSFKYYVDEPLHPKVIWMGDSHTIGGPLVYIQQRFAAKMMEKYSNTWSAYDGSGETSAQSIVRIPEILRAATTGTVVVWNYSTNDPGSSITAAQNAAYLNQFIDSMDAHGVITVIGTPIPEATDMTAWRDSAVNIATRRGKAYVDLFNNLKDGNGGGTDRNSLWNADGVHLNAEGNIFVASLFEKAIKRYLNTDLSIVGDYIPESDDVENVVGLDYFNHFSTFNFGNSNKFIRNIGTPNTPTAAQPANINTIGQSVFQGDGTPGTGDFIVTGNGNIASPAFKVDNTGAYIPVFIAGGGTFEVSGGGVPRFGTSYVLFNSGAYIIPQNISFLVKRSTMTSGSPYTFEVDDFGSGGYAADYKIARFGLGGVDKLRIDSSGVIWSKDSTVISSGYDVVVRQRSTGKYLLVDSAIVGGGGGGGSGADLQLSNLTGTTAVPVNLLPATDDAVALGSTSKRWSDAFFASGAVINFSNGATNLVGNNTAGELRQNSGGNPALFSLAGAYGQIQSTAGDFYITAAGGGTNLIFRTANTERARLDPNGNLMINGTTAAAGSAYTLQMFNTSNPPTGNISGSVMYAESGEMKVRDGTGNITTISPHAEGLLPYKLKPLGWTYNSIKDDKQITVDMLKAMETIEQLTKEIEELKALVYKNYKAKKAVKLIYKGRAKK